MLFDKFLLADESRALSQADKGIKRVFGKIDVFVSFIIQKFASLKSKHFSPFFCWEINLRELRASILQKVHAS